MVCDDCGERFLEDHDAFDGKVTVRLAKRLVADAQVMPIRALSRRGGVAWFVINTLVLVLSDLIVERRRRERCSVLLVDETSMRRYHRYVTVIVNGDTGHKLGMVPHRDSATIVGFLNVTTAPLAQRNQRLLSPTGRAPTKTLSKPVCPTPSACSTGDAHHPPLRTHSRRAPKPPSTLLLKDLG